jgi:deazaflavin-dependent oxidoreductase (nitroreductase family)
MADAHTIGDCGKTAARWRSSTDGRRLAAREDAPMPLASAAHARVYRASRGRLGTRIGGHPVLLLTTIGRRTARSRTTPVQYGRDGERLIVIASNAGRERPPAWWLNLRDEPVCGVQVRQRAFAARAVEAVGAERERLWHVACAVNPAYAEAQERSPRSFAIVALERVDEP